MAAEVAPSLWHRTPTHQAVGVFPPWQSWGKDPREHMGNQSPLCQVLTILPCWDQLASLGVPSNLEFTLWFTTQPKWLSSADVDTVACLRSQVSIHHWKPAGRGEERAYEWSPQAGTALPEDCSRDQVASCLCVLLLAYIAARGLCVSYGCLWLQEPSVAAPEARMIP